MDIERLKYLWSTYQRQMLSVEEEKQWRDFLRSKNKTKLFQDFLDAVWEDIPQELQEKDVVSEQAISIITHLPQFKKKRRLFSFYWASAAAILIIGMIWMFWGRKELLVEPGMNKASLTLPNGDQIILDEQNGGLLVGADGLTYVDGSKVLDENSDSAIQTMILKTPRGGQYKIQLADGTKVFLNADSRLVYPSSFSGVGERKVELQGEAYFEVTKDTEHPFLVISKGQSIRVLGTKFMLSCYPDEETSKTTLLEGIVTVKHQDKEIRLEPNEQTVLNGDKLDKVDIDASEELAWINGEFIFNKESLASIMKKLARWYDVDVVFQDSELKNEYYEGVLNRFDSMKKVLDKLEATNSQVKFKISNKQVLIYKTK
ncbi:FecR family protein [Sphingobacterium faecale]|uniref:DUF4974 domain-containing protein n=1 Tax=Sphingobacterium faecale TaxID=2803775 RepID=A0ABS1R2E5_9SPHI|nr:FecR family protein [Sphingobacterium faecale]MBL1408882.1 DUF4974 domain-containing protein [Sphingobacterium faecale]